MDRSKLKAKLAKVKKTIAKIEGNDDVILYITKDKFLDGVGYINEIEDIQGLLDAKRTINKLNIVEYKDEIESLGLKLSELPGKIDTKILGYTAEHWDTDIKTRLGELRIATNLSNLKQAEELLTKHLSSDDKFDMDMDLIKDIV
jgi:hypothetical protein